MRGSFADSVRKVATSTRTASAMRSARRVLRRSARRRSESASYLLLPVALEDVADFDVVEVLDADAALESFAHFLHVVLEASERSDSSVVDFHAVADDSNASLSIDDAASHRAPGDDSHPRHLE